ncbi:multi-sensor signal transduction multi-kinase [Nitzschia inconspicua]|uniref:Multi-sensor signal transduction multi-kinase n=1 Tax=Nitzschia inconspicua TaxID=303405 RepID=A0A9K3PE75_9STRA|nr:multi-sensor signal transduction multi-kinase [Nitzschia inconspicua]
MIIDNLQALDQDSWSMLYTIIKSQTLTNFLFVGVHDENTRGKGPEKPSPDHPDPPIWQFEQSLLRDVRSSRLKSKQNDGTAPDEKLVASAEEMEEYLDSEIPKMPEVTKIHLLPFSKVETRKIVGAILADEDPSKAEKAQLLSKVLYSWTHGNALCLIQTLRLLNDQGLLKTGQLKEGWDWNEKSIEQRIEEWKTTIRNGQSHKEIRIVVTARINALPAKVKFVVVTTAALQQTYFSSRHLFRVLKAAHPNNKGLSKENSKIKNKNEEFPISSSKELESVLQHACDFGLIKRLSKEQSFAFAHDIIQDCAYALLPKKAKGFGEKSTNPAARKDWQIHCRMGTEYSVLAMMKELPIEERDRYKFLAADQLVISQKVIWDDRNSIAKLLLETAELCVIRSAFASSTVYLETGINLLDKEEQFSTDNAVTCFRMYLWLAKMRLACGNIPGAKDACQLLLDQAKTLKDKVPVVQVYIQILLVEGSRQKALEEALSYLEQMGESFPKAGVADAIDRELDQLRKTVQGKENNALLRPKRITDKKTLDVLVLLANVLEISRLSRKRAVQELAMIRMMNLSLQAGFSRQYPMAFAYFSTTLVQRGIKANDAEMVKEAHRMGQVCEKMARLSDFYGGFSVALFHWHVSHWKRLYKRTLEPVLRVYNAQLDSGDFFHVEFSIFTYMNLHLASGYSLDKLNDNVQLFFGLYQDYSLSNKWRIDFPRIFVSNMLGESEKPLIFFGETVEEEGRKIAELEQANETEALEYLNFLRLYMAVFFHENDMAEECLAKLSDDIDGIWIPWVLFFQCFVAISKVPAKKGPGRKKLLESIEEIKEQLIVWYNDFHAPNPNAMVSLLEAELMMVKNVGRKEFPSIKIQLAFEEAISAARNDEMNHLEAFCCERAALHFEAAKLDGYVAEYMRKAYALYDQWNALAKIIDIEKKYAKLLKLSKQRTRPMATQPVASDIAANGERTIGGGRGAIRPVDIKKTLKKGAKNTRREIKALFGIHRATENSSNGTKESPPCSPESKNSPIKSPKRLPPPKSSPFTRKQKPAKVRTSDMDEDIREKSFTTNDQSSSEAPSSSSKKSPGSLKSPRFAKPKLKLPFGGGKKAKNSKNSSDCDESDGSDDS